MLRRFPGKRTTAATKLLSPLVGGGGGLQLRLPLATSSPPPPPDHQSRSLFHLPPLLAGGAVLAPKVLALLMLKKVMILGIIQQYGVDNVLAVLRQANEHAAKTLGPQKYSPTAKLTVDQGIDGLGQLVREMDKAGDQADAIVKWLKQLDPGVLAVFAKDLMAGAAKNIAGAAATAGYNSNKEPKVTIKSRDQGEGEAETAEAARANAMIQLILKRVPEVKSRYMVVLIEKDDNDGKI